MRCLNRLWLTAAALAPDDALRKRCLRMLVIAGILTLASGGMFLLLLLDTRGVIESSDGAASASISIFVSLALAGGTGMEVAHLLSARATSSSSSP